MKTVQAVCWTRKPWEQYRVVYRQHIAVCRRCVKMICNSW